MKFKVKVGREFEAEISVDEVVVQEAPGWFSHWQSLAVVCIFLLIFSSGVYAVTSDDPKLFTSLLNTIVEAGKAYK